ncbi:hypothetical protein [Sphingobacterium sp. UGAL515B_05]|uniref:hypothetical protein n=1 Tax=Sphingobacterium sp. UGAL515B_05 TaxID=2986767 RepID=UPI0029535FFA|nr:hypothetical protein [Sphingobacterium sp. UGAL515B_05]WON95068.1 hypothetical protein OK025_01325 [Sphingobacterium sp. UGAL515B_05]
MDHLRNSIKLYFSELSLDKIFKNNSETEKLETEELTFRDHAPRVSDFSYRTSDELNNLYSKLEDDWFREPKKQYSGEGKSIFYLLTHFNEQVLTEIETNPYVKYEHLLKWRDLSFTLGEDIFTTSYLAYRDVQSKKNRGYFSWKSTIATDNRRLSQILKAGVAENHAHFGATGPTFELSWIVLMNQYYKKEIQEKISLLAEEGKLTPKLQHKYKGNDLTLHEMIKLANVLRFELVRRYIDIETGKDIGANCTRNFFNSNFLTSSHEVESILLNFSECIENIRVFKDIFSHTYYHGSTDNKIDYAIPDNLHTENNKECFYFAGERILLYKSFYYVYKKDTPKKLLLEHILHAYLLIKNVIRHEIIQSNQRLGFGNFKRYQDRKNLFILPGSIYEKLFAQHVLLTNVNTMNIISHELRIGPNGNEEKINKTIKNILKAENQLVFPLRSTSLISESVEEYLTNNSQTYSESTLRNPTFFTLHFIKSKDTKATLLNPDSQSCRNKKLRNEVKKQAQGIVKFRNKYPDFAKFVKGIDAASSEMNARPEVFAQAFRMLKHHQLRNNEALWNDTIVNNRLNITFHAGEDFFDIIDGLRYIDECLCFLGMENGDRLGHALALGIDVQKYFELKRNKLLIPKHILLDNLAWILSSINRYGLKEHLSESNRLENLFKAIYSELYIANIQNSERSKNLLSHISYHEYYDAWMLRGDDPLVYQKFCNEKKNTNSNQFFDSLTNETYWERCQLNNCNPKLVGLRHREELVRLYYEYHYNYMVKVKGEEIKQFEITIPYINLVHDIQNKMMEQIAAKNIMIETNPTSNYLIGPIQKYIEHPITRWYNLGLETDVDMIRSCPQICVSINTDDAGVFSTSLENEYALMAIALEKEKDKSGNPKYKPSMIYDWLDRIRQMGIQQSFMNR